MNLLDAYVMEVLCEPYEKYGCWWVRVSYTCWSDKVEETKLLFYTLEDALAAGPGFMFLT